MGSRRTEDPGGKNGVAAAEFEALGYLGGADILHDNGMWLPHNHRIANLPAR
jgi:hypothetical protein